MKRLAILLLAVAAPFAVAQTWEHLDTWCGGGADNLSDTAANWSGGVPTLTDGGTFVNVQGGTGFTAADDLWLKGFDLKGSAAFALAAVAGKDLWLGSGGILGGTGTYTINAPLTFTTEQRWNFKNGATVRILDLQGREVLRQRTMHGAVMDVRALAPGLYHVAVSDGKRTDIKRFKK